MDLNKKGVQNQNVSSNLTFENYRGEMKSNKVCAIKIYYANCRFEFFYDEILDE